jgi:hypothetical protein
MTTLVYSICCVTFLDWSRLHKVIIYGSSSEHMHTQQSQCFIPERRKNALFTMKHSAYKSNSPLVLFLLHSLSVLAVLPRQYGQMLWSPPPDGLPPCLHSAHSHCPLGCLSGLLWVAPPVGEGGVGGFSAPPHSFALGYAPGIYFSLLLQSV